MDQNYSDLEIKLRHAELQSYSVELSFRPSESDTQVGYALGEAPVADLCIASLNRKTDDDAEYGKELSKSLFQDASVKRVFIQAQQYSASRGQPLRVRLNIDNVPELHAIRWETMQDPATGNPLLTEPLIFFSRFATSMDFRVVRPVPKTDFRVLAAISNPSDIGEYELNGAALAEIDVSEEHEQLKRIFVPSSLQLLADKGPVTLSRLRHMVSEGCDILYLMCHGAIIDDKPLLYLQNKDGTTDAVRGSELIRIISQSSQRPIMIVLVSCQSAGTATFTGPGTDPDAMVALGPRLAWAGAPAVLAMQGNVTRVSMQKFVKRFFKELESDGQADRAAMCARSELSDRADWWAPVLYLRLLSGRIWYAPGFSGSGVDQWPSVLANIKQEMCLPIIGPGIASHILGSTRGIARRWAQKYNYPMSPETTADLTQVAQYLAVDQQLSFPIMSLKEHLKDRLLKKYEHLLTEEERQKGLLDLISIVGVAFRKHNANDPHRLLAQLPLPVYVTTNTTNLLSDALKEQGRHPQVEYCRWNEDLISKSSIYDSNPGYEPTVEQPLVYHLFGHLKQDESLVLTEDDYFDYLIGSTQNKDDIPEVVRRKLTDSGLLFLGYRMDEWAFRILFRSIMRQEHAVRRRKKFYVRLAIQIDPEEDRIRAPLKARKYLEDYFRELAEVRVYWGNSRDFVRQLHQRCEQTGDIELLGGADQ